MGDVLTIEHIKRALSTEPREIGTPIFVVPEHMVAAFQELWGPCVQVIGQTQIYLPPSKAGESR